MPKYSISVPDPNKPAIRISGVKIDNNPFNILGFVTLERTKSKGGLDNYTIIMSDVESCFPVGTTHWSITNLFCNSCNSNIHSYNSVNYHTDEYNSLCHSSSFPIFSKHKINDSIWKIVIYRPENPFLDQIINELINERKNKMEFTLKG